jgi:tight adherence protein B
MILVFSILIAVAVVMAIVGVQAVRSGQGMKILTDRLRGAGRPDADVPQFELQRDERYSSMPWFDLLLRRLNLGERLELLLYQAGLSMRAGMLVMLTATAAMLGYLLGIFMFHRLFTALLIMAIATPIPYMFVKFKKTQRMKSFSNQFPDALDLLVSALRAGLSFSAAMQIVSEESPEPLATEFAITVEEQALGLDIREAMTNLTKRVDALDLKLFVTAVLLQRETGGNLAEVLQNSAVLIRDRFRILGDIQTFTAQGRMTAVILSALPIGVGLFTYAASPEYFKPMIESDAGKSALWFAGFLQLMGVLAIKKIVSIKV